ncbi:MAG: hypothetical protein MH204_03120 [Fimbriimonadaceae bacterium]|nr:hypothetical protein [Fimbriimonadaceae bacterium]
MTEPLRPILRLAPRADGAELVELMPLVEALEEEGVPFLLLCPPGEASLWPGLARRCREAGGRLVEGDPPAGAWEVPIEAPEMLRGRLRTLRREGRTFAVPD